MFETNSNIGTLIREREAQYNSGVGTDLSEHVNFDLKTHVEKIDAYRYSTHISGSTDSMGREKPFFNIANSSSNIWYRATDIDRRNIRIKATKETDMLPALVATELLHDFMRRENFGTFLNKWGRTLSIYGSAIVKFVEKSDGLHPMVMRWSNMIVDSIDFDKDVTIERLELTADELLQRNYDKDVVKALIDAREARESEQHEDKDQKKEFIKLYEVHGKMPKSFRTGNDKDRYDYEQMMFVVSFVKGKEQGKWDDYILVSGREERHPYMITHLIEEEDRIMGVGSFEHLFDPQWMTNHTAKAIKDQLDLASKLIFQTADDTFAGQNALQAIENGDILIHADNRPITQIANNSHDITALQSYGQQWEQIAKELTSTPDSIRGDTMPSGTAYRSVAMQNRESHSLFELMTENKGLDLERMLRTYVIEHFKKKMDTVKELTAVLDDAGIKQIDSRFIKYKAEKKNKEAVKQLLREKKFDQLAEFDGQQAERDIEGQLAEHGNTRFLKPSEIDEKTWSECLKDLEWDIEVEITNENTDKEVTLATLNTTLSTIASNPMILQDPNASLIFNKILEETGKVSAIELSANKSTPTQPMQPMEGSPTNTPQTMN